MRVRQPSGNSRMRGSRMPPMPKHHTKGRYLLHLDETHSDANEQAKILQQLRDGHPLESTGTIADVEGIDGQEHIKRDWLGEGRSGRFGSTGWWRNWKGDPESTLRCAFIRSLEMAMGLRHHCPCHSDPPGLPSPAPTGSDPAGAQKHLPIDHHWICGPSRFEAYVCWNPRWVTLVLITPGFPEPIEEFQADGLAALDDWAQQQQFGTIFIGQAEEPTPLRRITVMKPGVVTHHVDLSRGGSGEEFPGTPP
jgi:hypothetical protein